MANLKPKNKINIEEGITIKKNFLWGGSISANQTEGEYNKNRKGLSTEDIRAYNKNLNRKLVEKSLTLTPNNLEKILENQEDFYFPKRKGIDFYNQYEKDIDLFKEMNLQILRTSVAWTRIFPNGDEKTPNKEGLEYYKKLFKYIKSKNIKLMVTISHLEMPLNLIRKYGGWKNKKLIDFYYRYGKSLIDEFSEEVDYWIPFNEINHSTFFNLGLFDQESDYLNKSYNAYHNQFVASAKVIQYAKKGKKNCSFGTMIGYMLSYPKTSKPIDNWLTLQQNHLSNDFFGDLLLKGEYPWYILKYFEENKIKIDWTSQELNLIKQNPCDFITFSYYSTGTISADVNPELTGGNLFNVGKNDFLKTNEWGWQIDPIGLRIALNNLYDRYQKPIFITENGIGLLDKIEENGQINDDERIKYLNSHLQEMKKAESDGVDIQGYLLWSPIDLVSFTSQEMSKRYGLIYVDADDFGQGTYQRIKKKSFNWYKRVIDTNGQEIERMEKWIK